MKFDMVEINKLSPPGLWDLAAISAVISMLIGVIKVGIGGHSASLVYVRMITWHTTSLREKTRENLNMRIKAWVMQCPARIAWVRRTIGETAIKKWQKNRLADYALSKYFGDWKNKWPDGFKRKTIRPKQQLTPKFKLMQRAYNWKLFALRKTINVERFLFGRKRKTPEFCDVQAAYQKLWNVDILDTTGSPTWSQPRQQRILKPVQFTPNELVAEAATGTPKDGTETLEKINNTDVKKLDAPPKNKIKNNENTPEAKKKKPP